MKNDYAVISSHHTILLSTHHSNTNKIVCGPVLSHQDVDLSEDSEDGPIYIFESCSFNSLSNSGNGGAITCSASSNSHYKPQLIIKQSTFNLCTSSSGHGGGIYAGGLSSFIVEKTFFLNCNSTYKDGGGLFYSSSVGFPLLSDTSFISCYARMTRDTSPSSIDDAGGLYISTSFPSSELHYIIQGCRFLSCGCYNWGGGGALGVSYSVVGCANSLFSRCACNDAEGIGINLGTTVAEFFIHFCYFSCRTGTNPPTDVSINRNEGSFSSPFLHSFSTKSISKSLRTYFKWSDNGYSNWLIQ